MKKTGALPHLGVSMKKFVFFDGDGTLWYPALTKRRRAPHWIYYDAVTARDPNAHLVLTHPSKMVLKRLKAMGVRMAVISIVPGPWLRAQRILDRRVKHFGLETFFDGIFPAQKRSDAKGRIMERVLLEHCISKRDALMVGDSYVYDYMSAVKRGIPAVLIYSKNYGGADAVRVKRRVKRIDQIMRYVR